MEAGGIPSTPRVPRRSAVAGLMSLAVHGALVGAAVLLASGRDTPRRAAADVVEVQVIEPSPPPPPPPPSEPGGSSITPPTVARDAAGTRGRRGREGAQRSQLRALTAPKPLADFVVHYDALTDDTPGREDGTTGSGLGAALSGIGADRFSDGGLSVPPAPGSGRSMSRPPKPRDAYSRWEFRAPPQFAGSIVKLELTIDPQGTVRDVRIRRSVEASVDQRAVATAKRFAFEPARNDDGEPVWSRFRWEFVIEAAR